MPRGFVVSTPTNSRRASVDPDAESMIHFFDSLKFELGNINRFKELAEFYEAITLAIYYYNTKRIHNALKMSPVAYAAALKIVR